MAAQGQKKQGGNGKSTGHRQKKVVLKIALTNPTVISLPPPDLTFTNGGFDVIWDNQTARPFRIDFANNDAIQDVDGPIDHPEHFTVPPHSQYRTKAKKQLQLNRYDYMFTELGNPRRRGDDKGPPTIIIQ